MHGNNKGRLGLDLRVCVSLLKLEVRPVTIWWQWWDRSILRMLKKWRQQFYLQSLNGVIYITTWLQEYDACAEANGWTADAKIKKLPGFLRGEAASHYYALEEDSRKSYADATKALKEAMCPSA